MVSGIFCEVDIIVPWPESGNHLFDFVGVKRCMASGLTGILHRLPIATVAAATLFAILQPSTGLAADDLYTVTVPLDPEITQESEARELAYADGLKLGLDSG